MAKSIGRKIQKKIEEEASAIQDKVMPDGSPDGGRRVIAAGVAAVGAAGVAASVVHLVRKRGRDTETFHVEPDGADAWVLRAEGSDEAVGSFSRKKDAVRTARATAAEAAPSELVIHRKDGSVMASHSYERQ